MMEYYPNKSLDYFKANFLATMSLNTKIYLLFQIAQGIRFLVTSNDKTGISDKNFKIFHLDLKPANILVDFFKINFQISKNDIAKLSDFGESFISTFCESNNILSNI